MKRPLLENVPFEAARRIVRALDRTYNVGLSVKPIAKNQYNLFVEFNESSHSCSFLQGFALGVASQMNKE